MNKIQIQKEWRDFIKKNKPPDEKPNKCPQCSSVKIYFCPGSTCLRPVKGIWWMCEDCLNEW